MKMKDGEIGGGDDLGKQESKGIGLLGSREKEENNLPKGTKKPSIE